MNCPKCKQPLATIEYEGIQIETCSGCGGEWLDAKELGNVVRAREVRFNEDERRAIAAATTYKGVILKDVDRDLTCPSCGGQTDPINYGGGSGIIIDRCTSCNGVWLDETELEKIQMVVEGWEDHLPDDLKKYGDRLRAIAADVDERDNVRISRIGFINTLINGMIDLHDSLLGR